MNRMFGIFVLLQMLNGTVEMKLSEKQSLQSAFFIDKFHISIL